MFPSAEPPRNVRASDISKTSITLAWQKPAFDGGSKITGYIVEKRDLPDGRWTKASFTNVIETQFTVSGLTQDSKYEFRVFAKNAVGSISNPSDVVGPITCVDTYGKCFAMIQYNFGVLGQWPCCFVDPWSFKCGRLVYSD